MLLVLSIISSHTKGRDRALTHMTAHKSTQKAVETLTFISIIQGEQHTCLEDRQTH